MMKFIVNLFYEYLCLRVILCMILPYALVLIWFNCDYSYSYLISMLVIALGHFASERFIYLLNNFPGKRSVSTILLNSSLWFIVVWIIIFTLQLPYSLIYLILGAVVSILCCLYVFYFHVQKGKPVVWAYVSLRNLNHIPNFPNITWVRLEQPKELEQSKKIKGYVLDSHTNLLDNDWLKFLVEEMLKDIPVYHINKIEELVTGRVKIHHIHHMCEDNFGLLLPSQVYVKIKYLIDVVLILLSLPFVLPIMLLTAALIRLESTGSILFIQNRVGQGGKEFQIYKFRSMVHDSEENGARLASINDMRVTRIGKFIRKTRIDELPQFFNVLKGDMSLIGPRPEQKVFVDQFSKEIPFYNYRHIVKPGISGWAQVMHGYAADIEETKVKVEYDFFYIKHFSFSLDVLIFFKTIKTMLTGFGAR